MSEWISVEDRLPVKSSWNRSEIVIVWSIQLNCRYPFKLAQADIFPGKGASYSVDKWVEVSTGKILTNVTHWMPLPEPPK